MRYRIKVLVVWCLMTITFPFSIYSILYYRVFRSEIPFAFFSQLFSLIPGIIGQYIRTSYYKITLEKCSYDLSVGLGSFFAHPTASVGRGVVISAYSIIGTASIEDNVLISARVSILSGKYQHGHGFNGDIRNDEIAENQGEYTRVIIGENSWVGENSIVMESIENDCIVSAGSVVTKPMKANLIAVGNPARFLRKDYNAKK